MKTVSLERFWAAPGGPTIDPDRRISRDHVTIRGTAA
jgi:hypothetical protein